MTELAAEIEWQDGGVPVSSQFGDPYYSINDGLAETRHVFLDGNRLPERFVPGFHIAELGFGTGLNMLASLQSWRACGLEGPLRFTSFEAYPLSADEMELALRAFPEIHAIAGPVLQAWSQGHRKIVTDDLELEIIIGDARSRLNCWQEQADAWYLDGFAPVRNPELWELNLLGNVARCTRAGGTCATYTAAGHVRRGLADVGFNVRRVPGFGRKRHMTLGELP